MYGLKAPRQARVQAHPLQYFDETPAFGCIGLCGMAPPLSSNVQRRYWADFGAFESIILVGRAAGGKLRSLIYAQLHIIKRPFVYAWQYNTLRHAAVSNGARKRYIM